MNIQAIYQFLSQDMTLINEAITQTLKRCRQPLIATLNDFVLDSKSKKLRPVLMLLSFRAAGGSVDDLHVDHYVIKAGVAMELMHRASLVHDDVIDHAEYRHDRLSIQSKWNPEIAVAFGNFVYSEAFHLSSSSRSLEVVQALTLATREMCEGELIQVCERGNFAFSRDGYIFMIQNKTASLFAASCLIGAITAETNKDQQQALYDFGMALGIAFQMIDDTMDVMAPVEDLGKNSGQDLASGELTLPIIHLLDVSDDKEAVIDLIKKSKDEAIFLELRKGFAVSQAVERTQNDIQQYIDKANEALSRIPQSEATMMFGQLVSFLQGRLNLNV